jgi:hypothetical protein
VMDWRLSDFVGSVGGTEKGKVSGLNIGTQNAEKIYNINHIDNANFS